MSSRVIRDDGVRHTSLNPVGNEFVPPASLANLKKYKYSSVDCSIMSRYVLQSYWNFVVGLFPLTLAPNRITFTGFLIGMSATAAVMYFFFFEGGEFPGWVWYYTAATLFIYQTLDAIDGKQARRTGTGSPLGELFDHGCDAFLTPFVMINIALALEVGTVGVCVISLMTSLGLFTAIWEQYCTGLFDLGYLSGPTEGIILNCILFVMTGYYGPGVWDKSVAGPYEWPVPGALRWAFPAEMDTIRVETLRSLLVVFLFVSCPATMLTNVAHAVARPSVHASKITPFLTAAPAVVTLGLISYTVAMFPNLLVRFPFAVELTFGLLMSVTVTRLTVSRLCLSPYRNFHLLFYLLLSVLAVAVIGASPLNTSVEKETVETVLGYSLSALVGVATLQYAHMIISVFYQFSRFLNIPILSMRAAKQD